MATIFRQFNNDSLRNPFWNYANCCSYFITILVKNRMPAFGEVENGELKPSPLASMASAEWKSTPHIRDDMNIHLGEFIFMPDHFHALFNIGNNQFNMYKLQSGNQFGPQRHNVPSIVRSFKSKVTSFAINQGIDFTWHSRYHEHIVKSHAQYENIRQYIVDNPKRWTERQTGTPCRRPCLVILRITAPSPTPIPVY